MSHRLQVICTGKGEHGRIVAAELDVADDGTVSEVLVRRGRSPIRGKGTAAIGGRELPVNITARMTVTTESVIGANGTLRWRCPKCKLDRPLSGENLRRLSAHQIALASNCLDLSKLPR
jgi:hypothetical protein